MKQKKLHDAWLVLGGVILIRGLAGGGVNMTAPLFLPPVAEELGVGIGRLSIYFSIVSVVMIVWLPVAGKLFDRYDVRLMAAAGAALQTLSFAAFGLMNRVYGWYLLAAPYAMGATVVLNLMGPILINRWFSKNTGLMLGIQMAFVGLFGAGLQPLASRLIAQCGWRAAYGWLGGAVFLAVVLAAPLLLKNSPQGQGLLPYGAEAADVGSAPEPSGDSFDVSQDAAVGSASFLFLLLFVAAITGVGVFTQHLPTYGAILGYSLERTGAALAFASVGNAAGSIAIGLISDRIGVLKTCYSILSVGILAVFGFLLSGRGFFLFGLSTFLHGLTSSGIMVLSPILTLKFYGRRDYEQIYAKVSMGAPLASILLVPAYGFVYDQSGSYSFVLLGMLLLLLAALFCIAAGWKMRCSMDGCPGWQD